MHHILPWVCFPYFREYVFHTSVGLNPILDQSYAHIALWVYTIPASFVPQAQRSPVLSTLCRPSDGICQVPVQCSQSSYRRKHDLPHRSNYSSVITGYDPKEFHRAASHLMKVPEISYLCKEPLVFCKMRSFPTPPDKSSRTAWHHTPSVTDFLDALCSFMILA